MENLYILLAILFIFFLLIILWVVFLLVRSIDNLSTKLLQIEIVKKAENYDQAQWIWVKNLNSIQKFDKTVIDEQEKSFLKAWKKQLTEEEKEELEWKDWVN